MVKIFIPRGSEIAAESITSEIETESVSERGAQQKDPVELNVTKRPQ